MSKINDKDLKELFIEIRHNNKIAYEKLYTRYKQLVYGIAFSILKNKHDSEDIVQAVFTKIYEINKDKLPTDKEASWLYTTTKNQAISFLRKKTNNVDLESIYEIEDSDTEINKLIDQDSYNRLISKLSEKEKEIISLKILSNLSFEEISKLVNESTGTVKWRYYKSINTLKLLLSNLGMFIVTFIIGIKTFANGKKSNNAEQIVQDENMTENNTSLPENVIQGTHRDEEYKGKEEFLDKLDKNETSDNQEIIVQDVIETNTNYIGIGFLGISALFFITTITFLIIFAKHQLNRKKKASK